MLKDCKILLGVSGGIAAYKSAYLASMLVRDGAIVRCLLTENACRLISPRTFEAVTGKQVITSMWQSAERRHITHINLLDESDMIVVAPATANIIAKAANGIADDMLSTTLCAGWQRQIIIAPAMNSNMWKNPATSRNIELLKAQNWNISGPKSGRLACGDEGIGRMSEPEEIFEDIKDLFSRQIV